MKTPQEWWDEVKKSPTLFNEWLVKQYRGEVTAAKRIMAVVRSYEMTAKAERILTEIAKQEETHASWILQLLNTRGVAPSVEGAEDRYWKEVAPAMVDFETTCAMGAHAEQMRLERIRVIFNDPQTPQDVKATFGLILKQEVWHAASFAKLAGADAIARTKGTQDAGRNILGLVA